MRSIIALLTLLSLPAAALDVLVIDDGDSNTAVLEAELRGRGHTVTNSWEDHGFLESDFDGDEVDLADWDAVVWLDGYASVLLDMPESGQLALLDHVSDGGALLVFGASGYQYSAYGYNAELRDLLPLRHSTVQTADQTFICSDDDHPISQGWTEGDELELPTGIVGDSSASGGRVLFEIARSGSATYDGIVALETDLGRSVQYAFFGNATRTYAEYETTWSDDGISDLVEAGLQWAVQRPPELLLGSAWTVDAEGSVTLSVSTAFDPDGGDVSYSWDVGDDGSSDGSSSSLVFTAAGYDGPTTEQIALTVTDDEGESSTADATVTIRNVPPELTSTPASETVDEGTTRELSVSWTDPEAADTHTVSWDFGDGETGSGATVRHSWPDQGRYTVAVTVTDDDGGTDSASYSQVVVNADPVLGGEPDENATVGITWSFLPTVDDPGVDDVLSFSGTYPPHVDLDAATGQMTWTPTDSAIGSHEFTLTVSDGEGGSDTLTWSVLVSDLDEDGDGMSDPWEEANGLDPTDPTDAEEDPDGDGRVNLDEFRDDSDPNTYEGPGQPTLLSPTGGEEVADSTPPLTVQNADAPLGQALTYSYYVYADAELTTLVASLEGRGEGGSGTTTWSVTGGSLTENHDYWWTATASDSHITTAATSPAASFFLNVDNDQPVKPVVSTPFDEGIADSLTPELVLFSTTDPDRDPLTYTITLTDESGGVLASQAGLEADGETVAWTPDQALADETVYCWYGTATDDEGLESNPSDRACFFVDLKNDPPTAPAIVSPAQDELVRSLQPEIMVSDGVDPEGRATVHEFQLDLVETFDSEALQIGQVDTDVDGFTAWVPTAELVEDAVYHLRVRCNDGGAASDWVGTTFMVSADNALPDAPALLSPGDGHEVGGIVAFTVGNSADPEGRGLTYDFLVVDRSGTAVAQIVGVEEGADGQTTWSSTGLGYGVYTWTSRAVDEDGGQSAWAPSATFAITGSDGGGEPGDVDDTGGDPGLDGAIVDQGCSCASTGRGGASPAALLLGLGMLAGLLRRRSSPGS